MGRKKVTNYDDSEHRIKEMAEANNPQGVTVDPTPITAESRVMIFYDGLLAKDGADAIWLHLGYGSNNDWHNSRYYQMNKSLWGHDLAFDVQGNTRLNFCFKDSADNWDNNYGLNWSYEIHDGQRI